ncbi:MAG TPA: GMC family oxidoreductase N-terminal domain-containing protein [Trebonia sp.]|nr:GMC family oxidoreductase N-terminal domain-containing protein [Trebonia sp.]
MYDYVIVGGGSAGCVLAARLSEDPGTRVLLLEAGPEAAADQIAIPAAMSRLFKTRYDWNFTTVPQERAADRTVYWPRGRVLGGSSAMNAMIYVRGSRYDFDSWRDDFGCVGWGYRDLLPYFRRSEANSRGESRWHGAEGPLPVTDLAYQSAHAKAFVAAARRRGAPDIDDFNGPVQEGVGFYQVTQREGRRCSVADAYLPPAVRAARPNLTIRTGVLVTGVLIEGGRAAGVTVRHQGSDETIRAQAEVILAAGAVGSPQLLMLSGIGPADELRDHGIFVIADNRAVGANLTDHPAVPVIWSTPKLKGLWEQSGNAGVIRWKLTHKGPLTSNIAEAGGFARSDPRLQAPDLQWHVLPAAFLREGLADPARRAMTVLVTLVNVASRGKIALASRDPRHRPLIDPGYLTDSADLSALTTGVRTVRDYASAAPLSGIVKGEIAPGDASTDQEVRDYIRGCVSTLYHPAGTCAMGGDSPLHMARQPSVADPQLRVRGVTGLRVVDASVFPLLPRGNTNAAVIAVAERAADLIAGRAPLAPDPVDVVTAELRIAG